MENHFKILKTYKKGGSPKFTIDWVEVPRVVRNKIVKEVLPREFLKKMEYLGLSDEIFNGHDYIPNERTYKERLEHYLKLYPTFEEFIFETCHWKNVIYDVNFNKELETKDLYRNNFQYLYFAIFGEVFPVISYEIWSKKNENEDKFLSDFVREIKFKKSKYKPKDIIETVKDIDGNVYKTVRIGHQIWMAENLRVTKYNNGESIDSDWEDTNDDWIDEEFYDLKKGSCCNYGFNPKYDMVYGKLYNWTAVDDDKGLAPEGWHVPSIQEWEKLIDYLGGIKSAGKKLKETGYEHWDNSYENATNETGFSALPSGILINPQWFEGLGNIASWWSSSCGMSNRNSEYHDVWKISIGNGEIGYELESESMGLSVRCVKDIESELLTDIDDNIYETVQIGSQIWMAENLRVSRYRNGDLIPNEIDTIDWCLIKTGACCNYENNPDYAYEYGKLYNWYAVDDKRNLAPEGWHIPSEEDWQILIDYLGGVAVAGGVLKDTRIWNKPNLGATNDYGFSAVPLGIRHYEDGKDLANGRWSAFWSATSKNDNEAFGVLLDSNTIDLSAGPTNKNYGFSVRCVKDSNNLTI